MQAAKQPKARWVVCCRPHAQTLSCRCVSTHRPLCVLYAPPFHPPCQQAGKGKKQREPADLRDPLDRQLALLGLRVKNITADGNCFFRALSDQLQV